MIVRNVGGSISPDEKWSGPHLIVAAYDPGVTTGWSWISYPVLSLATVGVSKTLPGCEWKHGEVVRNVKSEAFVENTDSHHVDDILENGRMCFEEMVDDERGDAFVMVMERFDLRLMNSDPDLLAPVRIRSIWQDRLRESDVPRYYQTPSDAKRTVTNQRLGNWGMYDSHSGEHARDADRHNILFVRRFMANLTIRQRVGLVFPGEGSRGV